MSPIQTSWSWRPVFRKPRRKDWDCSFKNYIYFVWCWDMWDGSMCDVRNRFSFCHRGLRVQTQVKLSVKLLCPLSHLASPKGLIFVSGVLTACMFHLVFWDFIVSSLLPRGPLCFWNIPQLQGIKRAKHMTRDSPALIGTAWPTFYTTSDPAGFPIP